MTEEEKLAKIAKATNDLNRGKELLNNFNHNKHRKVQSYVGDCCKDEDYGPIIALNKSISGLTGSLSFMDLDLVTKIKVLKMVVGSIEGYIAELALEKPE